MVGALYRKTHLPVRGNPRMRRGFTRNEMRAADFPPARQTGKMLTVTSEFQVVFSFMISVLLNGENREFSQAMRCSDLLSELSLAGKRVALEKNGEIVPRSRYAEQWIANGDRIEIVVAVGGG